MRWLILLLALSGCVAPQCGPAPLPPISPGYSARPQFAPGYAPAYPDMDQLQAN